MALGAGTRVATLTSPCTCKPDLVYLEPLPSRVPALALRVLAFMKSRTLPPLWAVYEHTPFSHLASHVIWHLTVLSLHFVTHIRIFLTPVQLFPTV